MNKKNKGVSMISLIIVVAIGIIILVGGGYILKNIDKDKNSTENSDSNNDTTMIENNTIESSNVNDKSKNPHDKIDVKGTSTNNNNWQVKYVTFPQKAKEVTADFEEFTKLREFLIDLGKKETTEDFIKESINQIAKLNNILSIEILDNQSYSDYEYLMDDEEKGYGVATNFDVKSTYYTLSLSRDKKENYVGIRIGDVFRVGEGEYTRQDIYEGFIKISEIFETDIMGYSENINLLNELAFAEISDIKENEYNRINYSINKGADKLDIIINVADVEKGLAYVYVDFEYKVALNAQ